MKTFLSFTILVASSLIFLASCNTVEGSRSNDGRRARVTKPRGGAPQPYYGSNSEGNYYSATGDGLNNEYQPRVKRYDPARRDVPAPPSGQRKDWRKPASIMTSEIEY